MVYDAKTAGIPCQRPLLLCCFCFLSEFCFALSHCISSRPVIHSGCRQQADFCFPLILCRCFGFVFDSQVYDAANRCDNYSRLKDDSRILFGILTNNFLVIARRGFPFIYLQSFSRAKQLNWCVVSTWYNGIAPFPSFLPCEVTFSGLAVRWFLPFVRIHTCCWICYGFLIFWYPSVYRKQSVSALGGQFDVLPWSAYILAQISGAVNRKVNIFCILFCTSHQTKNIYCTSCIKNYHRQFRTILTPHIRMYGKSRSKMTSTGLIFGKIQLSFIRCRERCNPDPRWPFSGFRWKPRR